MSITSAGLRSWAKGLCPLEAAVELLVRAFDGRFARPGDPWIQPCDQPGWWWLDVTELVDDQIAYLSGGEQRMLRIVASLADGEPVSLAENVPGLDRDLTELVFAAIAHAAGSQRTSQHPHRPRAPSRRPERMPDVAAPMAGTGRGTVPIGALP